MELWSGFAATADPSKGGLPLVLLGGDDASADRDGARPESQRGRRAAVAIDSASGRTAAGPPIQAPAAATAIGRRRKVTPSATTASRSPTRRVLPAPSKALSLAATRPASWTEACTGRSSEYVAA